MNDLRGLEILRRNIRHGLSARGLSQTDLAFYLRRDKSWINKFLGGSREIKIHDLDRIADFLAVETYQLLQPGMTPITERRSGLERRSGHDRRVSLKTRELQRLAQELNRVRPRRESDEQKKKA